MKPESSILPPPSALRGAWALLLLSAFLAAAVLLGPGGDELILNNDSERDLFRIADLLRTGHLDVRGPEAAPMPNVFLGPGWYLVSAPILALDPSPLALHWFHVLMLVGGALLLFAALHPVTGPWPAAISLTFFLTNHKLVDLLRILLHGGLQPGLALIWCALLTWVLRETVPRRRARLLLGLWSLTVLMPQIHLNAAPFMVTLGLLTVAELRTRPWRTAPLATLASLAICTTLAALYTRVLLVGLDASGRETEGSLLSGWWLAVTSLGKGLGIGYDEAPMVWSVWLSILAGAAGLTVLRGRSDASQLGRWTLVLFVASSLFLGAIVTRLDWTPRYALGMVLAVHLAMALGLQQLFLLVRGPPWLGPAVHGLLIAAILIAAPIGRPPIPLSPLTAAEQERVLETLAEDKDLSWQDVEHRVHGPLFSGSAVHYVALATGIRTDARGALTAEHHLVITPEGYPGPAGPAECSPMPAGRGRAMTLCSVSPRIQYDNITATLDDQPCNLPLPLHRETPPERADPYGLNHVLPSDCPMNEAKGKTLTLLIPPVRGTDPLILLIGWSDAEGVCANAEITTGTPVTRECEPTQGSVGVFTFSPAPGPLRIQLFPAGSLSVLDLY